MVKYEAVDDCVDFHADHYYVSCLLAVTVERVVDNNNLLIYLMNQYIHINESHHEKYFQIIRQYVLALQWH